MKCSNTHAKKSAKNANSTLLEQDEGKKIMTGILFNVLMRCGPTFH